MNIAVIVRNAGPDTGWGPQGQTGKLVCKSLHEALPQIPGGYRIVDITATLDDPKEAIAILGDRDFKAAEQFNKGK